MEEQQEQQEQQHTSSIIEEKPEEVVVDTKEETESKEPDILNSYLVTVSCNGCENVTFAVLGKDEEHAKGFALRIHEKEFGDISRRNTPQIAKIQSI